jgi:hypothetical protein
MRLRLTVKSNNAEDEDNGQGHDHDRVDLEAGGFISVEPQHGARAPASTCRPRATRSLVRRLLCAISSSLPSHNGRRATGGLRRDLARSR